MINIKTKAEKKKLTIEIDLTKEFEPTKSGRSVAVARTEGFEQFSHDGEYYSFNCYLSKRKPVRAL